MFLFNFQFDFLDILMMPAVRGFGFEERKYEEKNTVIPSIV